MLLGGTKELFHRKENQFDCLLLFSRVAGPAGRSRDCRFWHNVKEKVTAQPLNPNLGWKMLCLLIRRSANVNLTELEQNYLPRILLKVTRHLCFKNSKNLQLLDIQACKSANKAGFQIKGQRLTKIGRNAFTLHSAVSQNALRSQIFAIFEA